MNNEAFARVNTEVYKHTTMIPSLYVWGGQLQEVWDGKEFETAYSKTKKSWRAYCVWETVLNYLLLDRGYDLRKMYKIIGRIRKWS